MVVAPEDSQTSAPGPDYVYPAGVAGVIGVSAIAFPGWTAPYSANPMEANNSVLISAPSNSELIPPDGYEIDGSAVAVPFVAATAALIKERWPRMPPALVARAIAMSARDRPSGGYSRSEGFGVLDPYDAVLDAGKVAGLTATAPAGAPGTVAASARFGDGPPGVISALPSARPWYLVSGALVVAGVAVLAGAAVLAARHRPRRASAPPPAQHPGGWSGPLRAFRYSSLRSRNRSFMLASIFTRPATQARAMFIGDSASDTTSSLFAVSRMSAGGSPGPISRTGASPASSPVPNVTPRSGIVTLIVWLPKYASRSAWLSSDSLLASFCSASRHCSAEFMCASFLNGRYRSRGG
ncbi:MAG: S8 family serine peptidase [Trebonia sp.]